MKFKYLKHLLLCILLLGTGLTSNLMAKGAYFLSDSITIGRNTLFDIPLRLTCDKVSPVAFQFEIVLPNDVILDLDINNAEAVNALLNQDRLDGHVFALSKRASNRYRFILFSVGNKALKGTNGVIMTLPLKTSENASLGNRILKFENVLISDEMEHSVTLPSVNGLITIDETIIIPREASIHLSNIRSERGKKVNLPVSMTNSVGVTAFQFDLTLPKEISLNANLQDASALNNLFNYQRRNGHILSISSVGNHTYRVVAFSMNNSSFKNSSGNILNLPLKVSEKAFDGTYPIVIENVSIADEQGKDLTKDFTNSNIEVYTGSTPMNGAYLELPNMEAIVNKAFTLPVNMHNFTPASAFQMDLILPENITPDFPEDMNKVLNPDRSAGHVLSMSKVGNNRYRFLAISMSNSVFKGSSGSILNIPLKVLQSCQPGKYDLTLDAVLISDAANKDITLDSRNGKVEVKEKIDPDMSSILFPNGAFTYNGTAHSLFISGSLPEGIERVIYSGNGVVNAGSYEITASFEVGELYNKPEDMKATLTVNPAPISDIYFPDKTFIYDGIPHSLFITGELPQGVTVSYTGNEQTDAGSYQVIASFAGEKNYIIPDDKIATLTISKANIDMNGIRFENKTVVYNGEVHRMSITGDIPTGITNIDYSSNNFTDAGIYEITASFTTDANHNQPESLKATLIIEQAEAEHISFENKEFTYDGQLHSLSVGELPSYLSVTYEGNGQKNAGTYEVTANFTTDKNHKKPASKTAFLTIHKANVDMSGITFENQTITFDAQNHQLIIAGELPSGVIRVNYSQNSFVNVGVYEITATFEVDDNHHKPADLKAILTINPSDIKGLSFPDATFTYDGNSHSIYIKGTLPDGVTVNYIGNEQTNAGIYTVTVQFTSDGNYETPADMTANLTINKANIDMSKVSLEDKTVVYNGEEHRLNIAGSLPQGILSVNYSPNKFIDAGTYEVIASFEVDNNHNQPQSLTASLMIEQAEVEKITFDSREFVYDGQVHRLVTGQLPEYVQVTYEGNDRMEAGVYTVTANFETDKNHQTPAALKAILTIHKAPVDMNGITFESKTVTFDGQPHTLVVSGDLPQGVTQVHYTDNSFTNTGTYHITASFEVDSNHLKPAELNATLTIQPSDITEISFPNATFTYNGNEHSIYISGVLPEGVSVTYEGNGKINAGTYMVTAKFTSDGNYSAPDDMLATMTINKANIDVSAVSFENRTIVYNGQSHSLEITGELPQEITEVTYSNNSFINAGTYEITVSFTPDSNHKKPEDMKATLFIEQAETEKISFEGKQFIYDGQPHHLFINTLPEHITVSYEGNGKTDAGTYAVTARFESAPNYKTPAPLQATLTILRADIDMSGIAFESQTVIYDGQPHGLSIAGKLPNGVARVKYTNNSFINVGTFEVTANFEADKNHNKPTEKKATLTIMPAIVDLVSFPDRTFTYDGNPHRVEIIGELPTGLTVDYENNDQIDAGTYQVIAKFTSDGNYIAPENMAATLIVNKANIDINKIRFENKTVTYNGERHELKISEELPEGITNIFYTGETGAINAGTYEVTASFEVDKNHHEIGERKATLTILRATLGTIHFPNQTFIYNGQEHSLAITEELPENVSVSYEDNKQINVGSYIVTAKFTSDANYIAPQNMTAILTIAKANVDMTEISFENQEVTYNGQAHTLEVALASNKLPDGISNVAYSENSYTAVGTYEVTASFVTNSNYNKPEDKKATLIIRPAVITGISFRDSTVVYDGNAHSLFIEGELPAGAAVEYEGNKQTQAGTYQVTAKFTTNRNYVTPENLYASLSITPATVSILSLPSASLITEGDSIKNSKLTGGEASVSGKFEWVNGGEIIYESGEYACQFVPTDQRNYETKHIFVQVNIVPAEKYTVTVLQSAHGIIRIINASENDLYKKGTLLDLEINPEEGYSLDSLFANGRPIRLPYRVSENATLSAKFKLNGTGIESEESSQTIVYAKDRCIFIESKNIADITIYSSNGGIVLHSKSTASVVSPKVEAGIYIVSLMNGQDSTIRKVTVTN